MVRSFWWVPLLAMLAGCGQSDGGDGGGDGGVGALDDSDGARLEQAAIRAGLVQSASAAPTGFYKQVHDGGADRLCITPGKGAEYRFGMEAHFGTDMTCQGRGTARLSGDRLILNFARSACIVLADYQGDRVVLPGATDAACQSLCSGRASLDGVSFPRAGRVEDSDNRSLCSD